MTEREAMKKADKVELKETSSTKKGRAPLTMPKPETHEGEDHCLTDEIEAENSWLPTSKNPGHKSKDKSVLSLSLSQSLHRKLKHKAQQEGVSMEEFASELLAEGLVLRAWEIMERKNAMRSGQPNANQSFSSNRANNGGGTNSGNFRNANRAGVHRPRPFVGNNHSGPVGGGNQNGSTLHGRRGNYQNILENSANFIEYVRSQEKKQR